jgi:hypothetical protein
MHAVSNPEHVRILVNCVSQIMLLLRSAVPLQGGYYTSAGTAQRSAPGAFVRLSCAGERVCAQWRSGANWAQLRTRVCVGVLLRDCGAVLCS